MTEAKTYNHPDPVRDDEKRPDIVIDFSNGESYDLIFIESKVGSSEGYNQLSDYAEILDSLSGYRHKLLVYITRDFDPKEGSVVFKNIPDSNVGFKQLRWHQFYQFLATQEDSELKQEITTFMQEYRMAQSNQFSSIDILALTNFPSTLKLIELVMWGRVFHKFEEILGEHKSLEFRKRRALQNIQWHGRYILGSWMPHRWWCFMGFFINSTDSSGYPTVRLVLEVDPKSPKRQGIIHEFRQISNNSAWNPYYLDTPNTWSHIALEKSLRDFVSLDDHVFAIEEFFLNILQDLENIRQQHPQLPWGVVAEEEEDVLEKESDVSN